MRRRLLGASIDGSITPHQARLTGFAGSLAILSPSGRGGALPGTVDSWARMVCDQSQAILFWPGWPPVPSEEVARCSSLSVLPPWLPRSRPPPVPGRPAETRRPGRGLRRARPLDRREQGLAELLPGAPPGPLRPRLLVHVLAVLSQPGGLHGVALLGAERLALLHHRHPVPSRRELTPAGTPAPSPFSRRRGSSPSRRARARSPS